MGDEYDRLAFAGHLAQSLSQVIRFLGGEDGCRLVQDQDIGSPVEHLEDLNALLLTDGQLPDAGAGIHPHAVSSREFTDLGFDSGHVQAKTRLLQPKDDVLGDRLGFDQHKVLVDHTNAQLRRIAG